jgi:hypothetical protein
VRAIELAAILREGNPDAEVYFDDGSGSVKVEEVDRSPDGRRVTLRGAE